jgi:hypothetical protein
MIFRDYLIIVIMTLCVLDLAFTFYYVSEYKNWQKNKPYKMIELNPLLVFLWTRMGFVIGSIVSAVVLLSLNYIVAKYAHISIGIILCLALIWTMYNHAHNTNLLWKLIEKYPLGVLPESVFGVVVGNNLK